MYMINVTKYLNDDLFNFYAVYEAHNENNARISEYDLMTYSVKFM